MIVQGSSGTTFGSPPSAADPLSPPSAAGAALPTLLVQASPLGAVLAEQSEPFRLLAREPLFGSYRTVERAESRQQALALLLMSPEFQRR